MRLNKINITILSLIFFVCNVGKAQNNTAEIEHKKLYKKAFEEQLLMLKGKQSIDFKRAVFITENAYHKGSLDYEKFKNEITATGKKLKALVKQAGLSQYKTAGNWAVFTYMTDSIPTNSFKPCTYDFDDFMGEKDWTKMFVTKLMKTKTGNCHSLPYYYKILSEEIGVKAHLALAPNHVYIKHIDEKGQWANVELTSGGLPRDQWIIKSMAVSVESIKNEIYMHPLNQKESIAMTMFDLASGYEFQYGMDDFYISIVDTALSYYPKCVPLLMSKANYYGYVGQNEQKKPSPDHVILKEMYDKQEEIYAQISKLGHKEMPPELYEQWVLSMEKEKNKGTDNK